MNRSRPTDRYRYVQWQPDLWQPALSDTRHRSILISVSWERLAVRVCLFALMALVGMGGCTAAGAPQSTLPSATSAVAPLSPVPPSPTAASMRVADLMAKAGCDGKVIGTQLYSKETGRCSRREGFQVTCAVFDSDQLRDEWIKFAKEYGGNHVIGPGWACGADSPDDAAHLVQALRGSLV